MTALRIRERKREMKRRIRMRFLYAYKYVTRMVLRTMKQVAEVLWLRCSFTYEIFLLEIC
jgi:hypothetical protein